MFYLDITTVVIALSAITLSRCQVLSRDSPWESCNSTENGVNHCMQADCSIKSFSFSFNGNHSQIENFQWRIVGIPGFKIVLQFTVHRIQSCCNFFEIRERDGEICNFTSKRFKVDQIFCRDPLVFTYVSNSDEITFQAFSHQSNYFQSIYVTYHVTNVSHLARSSYSSRLLQCPDLIKSNSRCGSNVTATLASKSLYSPHWPRAYGLGENCIWNIIGHPGSRIKLDFIRFDTEYCCDYVKVLENGMTTMKLSGRRNGNNPERFQYISSTDIVTVRFASDKNTRKKGFHLLYRLASNFSTDLQTDQEKMFVPCFYSVRATSKVQSISSPGWPYPHPRNLDCKWILKAPRRQRVLLKVWALETGKSTFMVKESRKQHKIKSDQPFAYISKANSIMLRFFEKGGKNGYGFRATYELTSLYPENARSMTDAMRNYTDQSLAFEKNCKIITATYSTRSTNVTSIYNRKEHVTTTAISTVSMVTTRMDSTTLFESNATTLNSRESTDVTFSTSLLTQSPKQTFPEFTLFESNVTTTTASKLTESRLPNLTTTSEPNSATTTVTAQSTDSQSKLPTSPTLLQSNGTTKVAPKLLKSTYAPQLNLLITTTASKTNAVTELPTPQSILHLATSQSKSSTLTASLEPTTKTTILTTKSNFVPQTNSLNQTSASHPYSAYTLATKSTLFFQPNSSIFTTQFKRNTTTTTPTQSNQPTIVPQMTLLNLTIASIPIATTILNASQSPKPTVVSQSKLPITTNSFESISKTTTPPKPRESTIVPQLKLLNQNASLEQHPTTIFSTLQSMESTLFPQTKSSTSITSNKPNTTTISPNITLTEISSELLVTPSTTTTISKHSTQFAFSLIPTNKNRSKPQSSFLNSSINSLNFAVFTEETFPLNSTEISSRPEQNFINGTIDPTSFSTTKFSLSNEENFTFAEVVTPVAVGISKLDVILKNFPSIFNTTSLSDNHCQPRILLVDNERLKFNVASTNELSISKKRCSDYDRPYAVMRCGRSLYSMKDGACERLLSIDQSPHAVPCNVTFNYLLNVVAGRINSTVDVLRAVMVMTSMPQSLSLENVTIAERVLATYLSSSPSKKISVEDLISVMYATGNLMKRTQSLSYGADETNQAVSSILSTFHSFIRLLNLQKNCTSLNILASPLQVQIFRSIPHAHPKDLHRLNYQDIRFHFSDGESPLSGIASLTIPESAVLKAARRLNTSDLTFFASTLDSTIRLEQTKNTSKVINVGTINSQKIEDVEVKLKHVIVENCYTSKSENPLQQILHKEQLVKWNSGKSSFERADDCLVTGQNNLSKNLSCPKVAQYAILFNKMNVPSSVVLTNVSLVGCIICVVLLLVTAMFNLIPYKLRNEPKTPALINICICLALLYLFFAFGIGRTENKFACDALAFFMHYFTITSFSWATVNAVQGLIDLKPKILLVHLLTYGIPLLLVFVNFSITVWYIDKQKSDTDICFESTYRAGYMCWLQPPSLFFGFLVPVAVLFVIDCSIFIISFKKIFSLRNYDVRRPVGNVPSEKQLKKHQLFNAVFVVVSIAFTWTLGYILITSEEFTRQLVTQWLFTVLIVFQGMTIFFWNCLRLAYVRVIWLPCIVKRPQMNE